MKKSDQADRKNEDRLLQEARAFFALSSRTRSISGWMLVLIGIAGFCELIRFLNALIALSGEGERYVSIQAITIGIIATMAIVLGVVGRMLLYLTTMLYELRLRLDEVERSRKDGDPSAAEPAATTGGSVTGRWKPNAVTCILTFSSRDMRKRDLALVLFFFIFGAATLVLLIVSLLYPAIGDLVRRYDWRSFDLCVLGMLSLFCACTSMLAMAGGAARAKQPAGEKK